MSARESHGMRVPRECLQGTEMKKISSRASKPAKTRRFWIEQTGLTPDDIHLCWNKSRGRKGSVPMTCIREVRATSSAESSRQPRCITVIYVRTQWNEPKAFGRNVLASESDTDVNSKDFSQSVGPRRPSLGFALSLTPNKWTQATKVSPYKSLHFVAPSNDVYSIWVDFLRSCVARRNHSAHEPALLTVFDEIHEAAMSLHRPNDNLSLSEIFHFLTLMGIGISKTVLAEKLKAREGLTTTDLKVLLLDLCNRDDIRRVIEGENKHSTSWSREEYTHFITHVQKEPGADPLFDMYAQGDRITVQGLAAYLMSTHNRSQDEVEEDTSRPLSEYFISASHNTYLVGSQVNGASTTEGYVRALQNGCRSVEIDLWQGDDGLPVVTHGRTLTSHVTVSDVLETISRYAFLETNSPLFLNAELHCDPRQQESLVGLLHDIFGERLVCGENDKDKDSDDRRPTVAALQGKVLFKTKIRSVESGRNDQAQDSSTTDSSHLSMSDSESYSRDGTSQSMLGMVKKGYHKFRPESIHPSVLPLMIYAMGVPFQGFNKKVRYAPHHLISFKEPDLVKIMQQDGMYDVVEHNRIHLSRVYPGRARLRSTNFLPNFFWAAGTQLVALNWQTWDVAMEMNRAMFRSPSGYILKPRILRTRGIYSDKLELSRSKHYRFTLSVLSAVHLPLSLARKVTRASGTDSDTTEVESVSVKRNSPFDDIVVSLVVDVTLYVPGRPPMTQRSLPVKGDLFHPLFDSTLVYDFDFLHDLDMLNVVFVHGLIRNQALESAKAADMAALSFCVSLGSLKRGYRHLALWDAVGNPHVRSALFVHSSVEDMGSTDENASKKS